MLVLVALTCAAARYRHPVPLPDAITPCPVRALLPGAQCRHSVPLLPGAVAQCPVPLPLPGAVPGAGGARRGRSREGAGPRGPGRGAAGAERRRSRAPGAAGSRREPREQRSRSRRRGRRWARAGARSRHRRRDCTAPHRTEQNRTEPSGPGPRPPSAAGPGGVRRGRGVPVRSGPRCGCFVTPGGRSWAGRGARREPGWARGPLGGRRRQWGRSEGAAGTSRARPGAAAHPGAGALLPRRSRAGFRTRAPAAAEGGSECRSRAEGRIRGSAGRPVRCRGGPAAGSALNRDGGSASPAAVGGTRGAGGIVPRRERRHRGDRGARWPFTQLGRGRCREARGSRGHLSGGLRSCQGCVPGQPRASARPAPGSSCPAAPGLQCSARTDGPGLLARSVLRAGHPVAPGW